MTTQTRTNRTVAIQQKVNSLEKEVLSLRSLISGIVVASDSDYKPSFIRLVKSRKEQTPTEKFTNSADFLAAIKEA